ncbi:hypothetical protein [Saccharopolyspora pogona]|uniref:hypothetical protein n=1 Tax=Saccharopolyspora pogona TaxID=333966 RepID=UPI001685DF06|nr:hypothetical protein [Saccharopolyspora pogona]
MTWQDELQNLDAELAAGRISAEEYRQRRDAVLGRAQNGQNGPSSGGFPQQQPQASTPSGEFPQQQSQAGPPPGGFPQQQPQVGPSSGGFPQQQPQAGPQSGGFPQQQAPQQPNPFPPAFSWGDAAAQATPQQQPQQQGRAAEEATQIVLNPLLQRQPQAQPPRDSESTQVVNLSQQPQWAQVQQPPQPQWGPQQGWGAVESTGTPWGDDLPATPDHGDASWMRQGPEVFESASKPGKGKLIAGLSIGGVLLVGVIVAGILYFTSSSGNTPTKPTAAPPPPPVQTQELPAPPPARANPPAGSQETLVTVSGPAHPWSGALDLPSLQGAKGGLLQPKTVLDSAIQGGLVDGWFNGTEGATPKKTLLALQMPNSDAAKGVVDKYLAAQQGLSEMDKLSYQGVKVVNTGGTFRTAYVAHNWAIIIDVSGSSDQKAAAQETFKSVLDQQVNHLPPTVRD